MQDNELDKLINDAANQHHPGYDDKAWDKMLVLLNQHLPEKKDRRRPVIFWLLLAFLLAGGILLSTLQPWKTGKQDIAAAEHTLNNNSTSVIPSQQTNTSVTETVQSDNTVPESKAATADQNNNPGTRLAGSNISDNTATASNKNNIVSKGRTKVKIRKPETTTDDNTSADDNNNNDGTPSVNKKLNGKTKTKITAGSSTEETTDTDTKPVTAEYQTGKKEEASEVLITEKEKQKADNQQKDSVTKAAPVTTTTASNKQKSSKKFADNFALTLSGGADMSFVELNDPGKVKFLYGAGVSYSIGKHLKVNTGFYVSKKVYEAKPYQYKFPSGASYPYLSGIDANCNVYEIPVNVYYSFAAKKQHSWFVGTGASSLLMKKEKYAYNYLTPTGQSYSYSRTVTNENKHYFSVITLSGGYQYKLSNRIALAAEPYTKIPITGIGAGKIKLNSSGILISAVVKPFGHTKK